MTRIASRFLTTSLFAVGFALPLAAQQRIDVDVTTSGGSPALESDPGGLSGDAHLVAFASDANDLVVGDPGSPDVFVRDLTSGTTTRLTSSFPANYSNVRLSGDGRHVGYAQQNFGTPAIQRRSFVHDRVTGTTIQLAPSWFEVTMEDLNQDGRYAVVTARETNVPTSPLQVLRVDLVNGSVVLCTRDVNGNPAVNGDPALSLHPRIDEDGTHVAFASASPLLVPGDTNGVSDVFLYDIPGDVMIRASVSNDGAQALGGSARPSLTKDGRFVAFDTLAPNFAPRDVNGALDVYVRDVRLSTTTHVSLTTLQAPYSTDCTLGTISGDGRYVAFSTLVPTGAFSSTLQVRLRDLENGVTLPVDFGGAAADFLMRPVELSDDGRSVLVERRVTALSPLHLQLLDYGPPCSASNYCVATPNSTGQPAFLSAQGSASREQNNLVFAALDLPPTAVTLLYSGTSAIDPGSPFGDGSKCVGGTIVRHTIQQAVLGTIIDAQDVRSPEYANVHPGDTRYYQVLYRDPDAGGVGFNTTDAVAVTFCW